MGVAALLVRQPGHRGPEDARVRDGVERHLVGLHHEVRRLGVAVEVEREVVRREHLAEGHRGRQALDGGDEAIVDAEAQQLAVHEPPEGVVPGAGDDGGAVAVPGASHGHVGGAATEELAERLDVLQPHPDLVGIDVDADPSDGQHVERLGPVGPLGPLGARRVGGCVSHHNPLCVGVTSVGTRPACLSARNPVKVC